MNAQFLLTITSFTESKSKGIKKNERKIEKKNKTCVSFYSLGSDDDVDDDYHNGERHSFWVNRNLIKLLIIL